MRVKKSFVLLLGQELIDLPIDIFRIHAGVPLGEHSQPLRWAASEVGTAHLHLQGTAALHVLEDGEKSFEE